MLRLFAVLRLAGSTAILAAVVATFLDTASRGPINPLNFFGYFTMQSNILAAVVLAASAVSVLSGHRRSAILELLRGCVTTYMVIVGVVYNLLLAGLAGGVELDWANDVLHVIMPIYLALDWVLFGDRQALPWSRLWVVLVYPIVWLTVILVRGATDGFVPYPFLDPASGYGSVTLYAVVIALAFAVVGVIVWLVSRRAVLRP